MGDLRLKAQSMFKLNIEKCESEIEKNKISSNQSSISYKRSKSKIAFRDKIEKSIDGFQFNLLKSANNGLPLEIEVLKLKPNLFSRKNGVDEPIDYIPIKQKVAMFLSETNFEFVGDEIIEDDSLQQLYKLICENDIYPLWKVEESTDGSNTIMLLLEVNPLVSLKDKRAELQKKIESRKQNENNAVVLYKKSLRESEYMEKKREAKTFLFSFFVTLYISVVILTVVFMMFDFFPIENSTDRFSLIALGWPYFIFTKLKLQFLFSFPIGFIFSIFIAFNLKQYK